MNIKRIAQLIKIDLRLNLKNIIIFSATLLVVLLLLPFDFASSLSAYSFMLYTVGLILTDKAFRDMHDPKTAFQYLLLPCSNVERLLSKFLLTTILFAIFLLILFYVSSVLRVLANPILYHSAASFFLVTHRNVWSAIGNYILVQSIFLMGAAFFKKNSVTKTILVIGCLLIVATILIFVFSSLICSNCNETGIIDLINESAEGVSFLFWIIVAPICWFFTYLFISHAEIK